MPAIGLTSLAEEFTPASHIERGDNGLHHCPYGRKHARFCRRLCRDCRRIVAYDVARPVRTIAASTALIGASGELAERLACLRDDCLQADTRYRLAAARRNAEPAVGTKGRVAAYRRALLAVKANRDEVRDATQLAPYEEELRLAMYGARLAGYLAAAQRLQARGRTKRALDLYHEATYFLEIHDAAKQLTAERARLEEVMAAVGVLPSTPVT